MKCEIIVEMRQIEYIYLSKQEEAIASSRLHVATGLHGWTAATKDWLSTLCCLEAAVHAQDFIEINMEENGR